MTLEVDSKIISLTGFLSSKCRSSNTDVLRFTMLASSHYRNVSKQTTRPPDPNDERQLGHKPVVVRWILGPLVMEALRKLESSFIPALVLCLRPSNAFLRRRMVLIESICCLTNHHDETIGGGSSTSVVDRKCELFYVVDFIQGLSSSCTAESLSQKENFHELIS
ncbi:hypothetical protein Tco_1362148 [Tanacetum coccineum]